MIQYSLEDPSNADSDLNIDEHTGAPLLDLNNAGSEAGLVGNFLHYISKESGNFYEFKKGNQETYAGNRGEALQDQDKFIADEPFVPQGTEEDSLMEAYSNSGYFDDPTTLEDDLSLKIINKISGDIPDGADPGSRNSNELIGGIKDETDYVVQHTVRALQRKNRFNMDEVYPEPDLPIDSNRIGFVKGDSEFSSSLARLKNAGASQLLKATGYMTRIDPSDINEPSDIETRILDSVEGPAYEAIVNMPSNVAGEEVPKISAEALLGMNATGVPQYAEKSVRAGTGVEIPYEEGSANAGSFGVTYNQAIRFEDFTDTHKIKTALRMITMYKLLESLYTEIIDELVKEDIEIVKDDLIKIASSPTTANAGRMALGLSRKSNKFIANNYLFNNFLTPTDFPYSDCFYRGVEVIFGKDVESSSGVSENLTDIYDSPGFWLAISNVAIKKTFKFSDQIQRLADVGDAGSGQKEAIRSIINEFGSVAKIANIFAIIGEKSLHWTNADQSEDDITSRISNPRDPDQLDNIPGNRVGKSRRKKTDSGGGFAGGEIGSETTLAWEQSDVPSAYLLPLNIFRAASDLNNTYTRVNPARGMLGSRLVRNTYTGIDTDGSGARIPETVVKILEDKLDSEYVPFYIQDLRTNEIIAFHAFLNQLTDSIQPQFNSTQGYGRIDPVQTYQSTTRTIQVGFTLYSTNREDFDDMWYKINKFVTLMYPQWTQGTIVQTGDPDNGIATLAEGFSGSRFVQPFSQVIGSSPIVRLRIGDVVKSNYSRFALARTFGIGDQGVKANPIGEGNVMSPAADFMRTFRDIGLTIFGTLAGSPQGLVKMGADEITNSTDSLMAKNFTSAGLEAAATYLGDSLINGFVNPLLSAQTLARLRDPNVFGGEGFAGPGSSTMFAYINPNMIDGYKSESGKTYYTTKRITCKIKEVVSDETGEGQIYKVEVTDYSSDINGEVLLVRHEDIWNDPSEAFSKSVAGILYAVAGLDVVGLTDTAIGLVARRGGASGAALDLGAEAVAILMENPESAFMRPSANPFVSAFHATRGRGLAGVIKGVTFNWLEDFPWETDHNARAPIGCNIAFTFDVIHDIPPGLDHTGYNRAPLYNVGEVMRNVAGDVYDDRFSKSERKFREGGKSFIKPGSTTKSTGKP